MKMICWIRNKLYWIRHRYRIWRHGKITATAMLLKDTYGEIPDREYDLPVPKEQGWTGARIDIGGFIK